IGGGSRRWIPLGPVSIQPSEFMKLGLVLVLARHFARSHERGLGLRAAVVPMLLTAVPAAAILAQPDLGTVAIPGIVSLTMLMLGGIRLRWFVLLGVVVAVAAPLAWPHLKVYQQKRILTFVHPEMDPRGAGYHVLQSKIAVGSGMMWGKGFLRGTQNQLNFLPEQHTDFIFSVFAEEWGFVGALAQRERRGRARSASAPPRPRGRGCAPSRRSEAETAAPPLAPPTPALRHDRADRLEELRLGDGADDLLLHLPALEEDQVRDA